MTKLLFALIVGAFALSINTSGALAGGGSESTGEGFHCYLFFTLPDQKFAQVMINDSDKAVVEEKVVEATVKYLDPLGEAALIPLHRLPHAVTGNTDICPDRGRPPSSGVVGCKQICYFQDLAVCVLELTDLPIEQCLDDYDGCIERAESCHPGSGGPG